MTRQEAAEAALQECFWGDYVFSSADILSRLDSGDPEFARFLFGKIADNARYASRLIRVLFQAGEVNDLLVRVEKQPRWNDRRHRLIRANLTACPELVPERMWRQ